MVLSISAAVLSAFAPGNWKTAMPTEGLPLRYEPLT